MKLFQLIFLFPAIMYSETYFGEQIVISTDADAARSVHASDLDGDGDMDVLSTSFLDDKIAWYENDGDFE